MYDSEFFEWHKTYVDKDCFEVGVQIQREWSPRSVIDFGCGIGSFIEGMKEGGCEVVGYEYSPHAKEFTSAVLHPYIHYVDLTKQYIDNPKEFSICVEVAEHLEEEHADRLVEMICDNTQKLAIFSAADMGQEGHGHVNCQPKQYWIDLFEKHGMNYSSRTDQMLKTWSKAPKYYTNNLMTFEHSD